MRSAVIVDAVRTPIGRSHAERGVYRDTRSDDLAAACVQSLVARTGIDPGLIDDLVLGCANQTLEQGINVARIVALIAGLPARVGGTTVNRLCGSGLQALNQAAHAIAAGAEDIQIVGGLEHMHHLPMGHGIDINPRLFQHTSKSALLMGVTAEYLAKSRGISRCEQDEYACESHRRAASAFAVGEFAREIIPMPGRDEQGRATTVTRDIPIRPETTVEALAGLSPAFQPDGGTVTAGNSSPLSDGAAALLVMSEETARSHGYRPLARIRSTAVVGLAPANMGLGPVSATELALRRAGLTLQDIDIVEMNEAFAVQTIACLRDLQLDPAKTNIRGGAIALGHPLGASGARIVTTLVHLLRDRDATFGLATMCVGLGQGMATIIERMP